MPTTCLLLHVMQCLLHHLLMVLEAISAAHAVPIQQVMAAFSVFSFCTAATTSAPFIYLRLPHL